MSSDIETGLSPDEIFEILSSRRRRMVLYLLRQRAATLTVNELAEEIAAIENEVAVDELTSQQRKRVYVSLYQTHLPKLEETTLIDYDADAGEVSLTSRAGQIDSYLAPRDASTYPWQIHYAGLVLASALVVGSWVLGIPGLAWIPFPWLAAAIVTAFAVSGGIHYWQSRQQESEFLAGLDRRD